MGAEPVLEVRMSSRPGWPLGPDSRPRVRLLIVSGYVISVAATARSDRLTGGDGPIRFAGGRGGGDLWGARSRWGLCGLCHVATVGSRKVDTRRNHSALRDNLIETGGS